MKLNHSIKKQYAFIFGLLLCGTFAAVVFLNVFTLGKFYIIHKKNVMLSTYRVIDSFAQNGDITSEEFTEDLNKVDRVNNIEVLILDTDSQALVSSEKDTTWLTNRLLFDIFSESDSDKALYKDSKIQINKDMDPMTKLEYIELWGVLTSGELILMRSPMQSMREAAFLSNSIFVLTGFLGMAIGIIIVIALSRRLTKPIMNLVGISEKITHLDFSEKYEAHYKNEIDLLGTHINEMSEKLENTITELKTANTELQKDIENRNKQDEMRKDFVSNVSHELKTPIALVQGYAEGLKDCVNDDAESRDFYCDVIIDEANKMNKLVRNLLALNEIEYGINNVQTDHFDIVELIYNSISAFDIMIKKENVKLELPPEDEKIYVWADEFRVEQILNNYVSNAIHYVKDAMVIRIFLTKHDSVVRISVFNSGDTIPEDVQANLWDKFYKADKARTREYGGSGIGLSIVKAGMEAMGHDYGVINHEDGVEFYFELDAET